MGSAADSGGHAALATAFAAHPRSVALLARESWPAWLVAWSLNGFFLYLAALDALDVAPRTSITGIYYAVLATGLLAVSARNRAVLVARLRAASTLGVVFVSSATLLSVVFVANVALLTQGSQPWKFAALLMGWSLPTAVAAASLQTAHLHRLAQGLVALGSTFAVIELLAALTLDAEVSRFSPIANLDPINAGLVPALGAVALLTRPPTTGRMALARLALFTILAACVVLPGSRGPLVALVGGSLIALVTRPGRFTIGAVPCLAAAVAIGVTLSNSVGSYDYLTADLRNRTKPGSTADRLPEPISTLSIRRQWLQKALSSTPSRPLFGHGVGMLVDDTPEAVRMGVAGQRTYPHNTFAEALFSLGLIGTIPFLAMLGSAGSALILALRAPSGGPPRLVAVLAGFALVTTNVSGEIGTDSLLWTSAALAVAVYSERRRVAARPIAERDGLARPLTASRR